MKWREVGGTKKIAKDKVVVATEDAVLKQIPLAPYPTFYCTYCHSISWLENKPAITKVAAINYIFGLFGSIQY